MQKLREHFKVTMCVCVCFSLSCVPLFETPWIVAQQAPLSMGFSRQECWSGLHFLLHKATILWHKLINYIKLKPQLLSVVGKALQDLASAYSSDSEGQGSLACCSMWGRKELDKTGQLNNSNASDIISWYLFQTDFPHSILWTHWVYPFFRVFSLAVHFTCNALLPTVHIWLFII